MEERQLVARVKSTLHSYQSRRDNPQYPFIIQRGYATEKHFIDAPIKKGERLSYAIPVITVTFPVQLKGEISSYGSIDELMRRLPKEVKPNQVYFSHPHQSDRAFTDARLGACDVLAHFYTGNKGDLPLTVILRQGSPLGSVLINDTYK
jgi:hypothetical protein